MKQKLLLFSVVLLAICTVTIAQVAYEAPAGGWTYIYQGDQLMAIEGDPDQILDGSWIEKSGKWDFLELGDPLSTPGGLVLGVDVDGVDFLRIQDAGEPRDFAAYEDINRKLHFAHNLDQDGVAADATILDDGVTLAFRLKVPLPSDVDAPLEDPLWPADGLWEVDGVEFNPPYPVEGDGYYASEGLGMIGINHGNGMNQATCVGFSLMTTFDHDTTLLLGEGLYMNVGAGPTIMNHPSLRDIREGRAEPGSEINVFQCTPTEWNEFWVQIVADPTATTGTHAVKIWHNGDVASPEEFIVTASDKNHEDVPYMHIGFMNSGENGAMDCDYTAMAVGLIDPVASTSGTFDMSFASKLKCYPNPSNGETTFAFNLKRDGYTTLEVYNLIGQPVAKVLSKDLPAGEHNIQLNVDLTPGQYVYRLQSGDQNEISKMTILK